MYLLMQTITTVAQNPFDCGSLPAIQNCQNYIVNNNFTPIPPYSSTPYGNTNGTYWNPFNVSLVPNWLASHGNPQIDDAFNSLLFLPPSPATNYAFMEFGDNYGEGIAQKISPLTEGQKYLFSFFKSTIFRNGFNQNETFKIVLMNCDEFSLFPIPDPYSHQVQPNIPEKSQTIYCEVNPSNPNWQQVVVNFVANSNFNMIWIFPEYTQNLNYAALKFAYPELYKVPIFEPIVSPNYPNCSVNLPAYCATPVNSALIWTGPVGQIISANFNQTIPIDVSDNNNVGNWTLSVNITNATLTNNSCSRNNSLLLSINVPACSGLWPKVYPGKAPTSLIKTYNEQIIMQWEHPYYYSFVPNLNHIGPLPANGSSGIFNFHYTKSGFTNWFANNIKDPFPLINGDIAYKDASGLGDNFFVNSFTGIYNNPTYVLPNNERIVAEIGSGIFVTIRASSSPYDAELVLRNSTSLIPLNVVTSLSSDKIIYNRNSGYLYVLHKYWDWINFPATGLIMQKINKYLVTNSSIVLANSGTISFPEIIEGNSCDLLQINDFDEIYFLISNQIKKFDITTNLYSDVSILNLHDKYYPCYSSNPYTENRAFVESLPNYQHSEWSLYSLDLSNSSNITYKQILSTPLFGRLYYLYDNDTMYLAGTFINNCQIGTQIMPLNNSIFNVFLTKLNLETDFYRNSTKNIYAEYQELKTPKLTLTATISPNPSTENIRINIKSEDKIVTKQPFKIIFKNKISNRVTVIDKYYSGNLIDISRFEKGLHFIEIISSDGQMTSNKLIKI